MSISVIQISNRHTNPQYPDCHQSNNSGQKSSLFAFIPNLVPIGPIHLTLSRRYIMQNFAAYACRLVGIRKYMHC